MNKIALTRIGVDGMSRSLDDIRDYLVGEIEGGIRANLNDKIDNELDPADAPVAEYIRDNLHDLLRADVPQLKRWADFFDLNYPNRFKVKVRNWKETDLCKALLAAFDFSTHRKGVLVEVAKQLNVKTCPYCNMHYTLYANEKRVRSVQKLARFQFDHFFDKSRYPMLSMSFYNLIPSCGVCNQGKSAGKLSLDYHPYHSDIHKLFHFELKDPLGPYTAARVNDEVEIELVPETGVNAKEFKNYVKMFHLRALYGRHGDVVQEVYDKAYEVPYYQNPANFSFLGGRTAEYLKRLWMGNYTEPKDIEKRPMAKFMQDLWAQAEGEATALRSKGLL